MSKFKVNKCPYCNNPIHRHDEKRMRVRVAKRVWKEAHLLCYQEEHNDRPNHQ